MSGKDSDVTSRETRLRILLMESELNRAALCHECSLLVDQLKEVGDRIHSTVTVASSFISSFAPSNGEKTGEEPAPAKPSWLSTIVRGVRFATSLWLAFRSKS